MLDREATIVLNLIPGIGHVKYTALGDAFGSPSQVFGRSAEELETVPGIGPQLAPKVANYDWQAGLDAEFPPDLYRVGRPGGPQPEIPPDLAGRGLSRSRKLGSWRQPVRRPAQIGRKVGFDGSPHPAPSRSHASTARPTVPTPGRSR